MQAMMDFCLWFLSELPDFLLSEPICYVVGFFFLFFICALIRNIVSIHR